MPTLELKSNQPAFIRVRTALARYGVGRTKLYALIAAGAVRAVKLGPSTLIDVAAADDFFRGLPLIHDRNAR
jgi:predicted DNA-binding transcriptional regulator AlpA